MLSFILAAAVGVGSVAVLSSMETAPVEARSEVPVTLAGPPEAVTVLFIDSLSNRVATDAGTMPALAAMAREGVTLDVEPCRDRLTYLCLRAAFTGVDQSSLLSVGENFDHGLRTAGSLFERVAAAGGRVVAIGARDFEAYADSFADYRPFADDDTPEATVLVSLGEARAAGAARITLVGLGSGDRAAHAYGPGSAEYVVAFGAIDRIVAEVARSVPPSGHLLVFGDHGHDLDGRHLPGGAATTWALYRGPAFRPGVHAKATITDHRALLGVLLGVPTPATYGGPDMADLFTKEWAAAHLRGTFPPLVGKPPVRFGRAVRLGVSLAVAVLAALVLWLGLLSRAGGAPLLALGAALLAALSGALYTEIREAIHNDDSSPERMLYLGVPLLVGLAVVWLRRRLAGEAWRTAGALVEAVAVTVVVSFLFLYPSANYYGAGRVVVFASLLAFAVAVAVRRQAMTAPLWGLAALVLFTLATFYDVRGVGGDGGAMRSYVMKASLYEGRAALPLVLASGGLWWLLPRRGGLDAGLAALVLGALLGLQLTRVNPGQAVFAGAALVMVLALPLRRRIPATLFALALWPLAYFYWGKPIQLAPIELVLCATLAALRLWERLGLAARAYRLHVDLTLLVSAVILLWPILGLRLSGIDYQFMFQWVAPEKLEALWWVIALGMVVKFGWPYALLAALVPAARLREVPTSAARPAIEAKAVLLATFGTTYAVGHSMASNLAMEIIAELAIITVLLGVLAATLLVRTWTHAPPEPGSAA